MTWVEADVLPGLPHELSVCGTTEPFCISFLRRLTALDMRPGPTSGHQRRWSVVIIGGFGPTGPEMCAGLPVRRQTVSDYEALFGSDFTIERTYEQSHIRPDKDTQDYLWVRAVRNG